MSWIKGILELQIHEIDLCLDEAVIGMVIAHEAKDDKKFKEEYLEYDKNRSMLKMGYSMAEHGVEIWDWKWVAETGHCCDQDWMWFEEEFVKAGITREEYNKKWKR